MADIQELMNKMEELNNEISTIINETKQGVTVGEAEEAFAPYVAGSGSGSNCPRFSRKIKLCCTTVVKHFALNNFGTDGIFTEDVKLIYDLRCLHAVVERKCINLCQSTQGTCGNIYVYVVKVVGCIPFAFSATDALEATCGFPEPETSEDPFTADLCCQGCVCVDNNICCYTDIDQAQNVRQELADVLTCESIIIDPDDAPSAELLECKGRWCSRCHVDGCKEETFVKFEAKLQVEFTCDPQEPPICEEDM